MTFKELKKRVSLETTEQQTKLFERLHNKPFWIWNIDEHKLEDVRTDGDCCFNHIINLPQKDGLDKPLYDYERIIFDSLVTRSGNNSSGSKHVWIKKATGLVSRVIVSQLKNLITRLQQGVYQKANYINTNSKKSVAYYISISQ